MKEWNRWFCGVGKGQLKVETRIKGQLGSVNIGESS